MRKPRRRGWLFLSLNLAITLALLASIVVTMQTAAAVSPPDLRSNVTLEQWSTNPPGWITGALQINNSDYAEGDVVPFRLDVTPGDPGDYSFTICRDFSDGATPTNYGYLFLAPFDTSRAAVPGGSITSSFGAFSGINVTITGVQELGEGTCPSGDRQTRINFTKGSGTAYILWGGHLAAPGDSIPGGTTVPIGDGATGWVGGASLHMRLGPGEPNRDVAIHRNAITPFLQPGTLTVIKQVINDDGGTAAAGDFTIHVKDSGVDVDGSPQPGSESGTSYTLPAGTYLVSEDPVAGYTASFSGDCDANGNVTLTEGGSATCTITNDDEPGSLTVIKQVINDDEGTAVVGDFTLRVDGNPVQSGVAVPVSAGSHLVSEDLHPDYLGTIGGDCDANGNVTVGLGEQKTCTITNDDIPPPPPENGTIVVVKRVINDNGGTAGVGDFTIHVTQDGTDVDGSPAPGSETGTSYDLPPGSYLITEESVPGYEMVSIECAPEEQITSLLFIALVGTTVDLGEGEVIVCTITNDDIPGSLTVFKHVVNDNGGTWVPEDFSSILEMWNGTSWTSIDTQPFVSIDSDDGSVTFTDLAQGQYRVREASHPGYHATFGTGQGDDCDSNGELTLGLADEAQCTITNDDIPGTLRIVKTVINDDGGTAEPDDFTFDITGPQNASVTPDTFVSTGDNSVTWYVDVQLDWGTYSVSEIPVDGYDLTSVFCMRGKTEDEVPSDAVIVDGDLTSVCEFVNDDIPEPEPEFGTLRIVKHVVNDDGGTAEPGDFTFDVTGPQNESGNPDTILDEDSAYIDFTLSPGTYTVSEQELDGYSLIGASCGAPAVIAAIFDPSPSAEVVANSLTVCEFTNDDLAEEEPTPTPTEEPVPPTPTPTEEPPTPTPTEEPPTPTPTPIDEVEGIEGTPTPSPTPIDEVEGISQGPVKLPETGGGPAQPVQLPWMLLTAFGASLVSLAFLVRRHFYSS